MDAVEHADGDHAMAPSGRYRIESEPPLHDRKPTGTGSALFAVDRGTFPFPAAATDQPPGDAGGERERAQEVAAVRGARALEDPTELDQQAVLRHLRPS